MSWNVVDSSGWLEYLALGPNADFFAPALEDKKRLLVPAACYYEVFKVMLLRQGEDAAIDVAALMSQGTAVPLAPELATAAAKLSVNKKLPMADAMIAATAQAFAATLWTQDSDFNGLPGIKYKEKKSK